MIHDGGIHPITGRNTVEIACDHDGCPEAHYAPDGYGPHGASELMLKAGWEIGTPHGPRISARCPTHRTTPPGACTHPIDGRAFIRAGYYICGTCQKRMTTG